MSSLGFKLVFLFLQARSVLRAGNSLRLRVAQRLTLLQLIFGQHLGVKATLGLSSFLTQVLTVVTNT